MRSPFGGDALAQASKSIVSTWVPAKDKSTNSELTAMNRVKLTFKANGESTYKGTNVDGNGKYRVQGCYVILSVVKRGGVAPKAKSEASGRCIIAEGGSAILMKTGRSINSKPVLKRLVRKK